MKSNPTSQAVLHELAGWCELARKSFTTSLNEHDPQPVRILKEHLAGLHGEHCDELHRWLAARKENWRGYAVRATTPQAPWAEVTQAMASHNVHVVRAACWLMERVVQAAYDRAAKMRWLERSAQQLIQRHVVALESARVLVGLLAEHDRIGAAATSRPAEKCPVMEAMAAS